ncbi:hypothetical protein [Marinobacterium sedimentorum]|uniref:hypothetical protein n=1 Tax=Marinobacterium sedimentorum TaxID=2927804 RepID=UPI0020C73437|nr:hypothetical protein [Marinobacterium sedimentorum]MCP8686547.1 hypothetical protein [Marinobacterium sedimentorum]
MESSETPRLVTMVLTSVDEFHQQLLIALHALADPPLCLALEVDFVMQLAAGLESRVPVLLAPYMVLDDFKAVESALDTWGQAMADWVQQNAQYSPGLLSVKVGVSTVDGLAERASYNVSIAINR